MWANLIGQPTCRRVDRSRRPRSASALALVPALQQPRRRAAVVAQLPWQAEVVEQLLWRAEAEAV
jgi:hypothetical protein